MVVMLFIFMLLTVMGLPELGVTNGPESNEVVSRYIESGGARSSRKQKLRSAAYSVREHRKTEVDAEIRRSSQVEESVNGSWGHPCEINERFVILDLEKGLFFMPKNPQLPNTVR